MDHATALRNRCEGCAFRPGTEANTDAFNQMRVKLCLIGDHAFDCHENANPFTGQVPAHLARPCIGFEEARAVRRERGDYDAFPNDRQRAAFALLDATDDVLSIDRAQASISPIEIAAVMGAAGYRRDIPREVVADVLEEAILGRRAAGVVASHV
jgi:hypothetical protein